MATRILFISCIFQTEKKKEGQKDFTSQLITFTSKESVPKSLIISLLLSTCPEFSHEAIGLLRGAGLLAYTDLPNDVGVLLGRRTYLGEATSTVCYSYVDFHYNCLPCITLCNEIFFLGRGKNGNVVVMYKELNDEISKKGVMYKKVGDGSSKKVHLLYKGIKPDSFFLL